MATQVLLNAVTANTTGTLVAHTGPCSVFIFGSLGGCSVALETSVDDTPANVIPLGPAINPTTWQDGRGSFRVDHAGTYYLRAVVRNATSATSVSVSTTQ